jgi:16S rRNA (guanine527-N7)-methyltransferase
MERIRTCLAAAGIPVSDTQLAQLTTYYEMVIERNKVMNLTAITEREEFIVKHLIDSLAPLLSEELCPLFRDRADGTAIRLIDVGTGAGFPGIPLKILCPKLSVTLLDSLQKRVNFLQEVITALKLSDIRAVHMRAEEGGQSPAHREKYDLAVSRAVANLSLLAEYDLPFVKKGGTFLAYKSGEVEEEMASAERAIRILGGLLERPVYITLPDSDIRRAFLPIRKEKPTPKAYPRKAGTAKKDPL